MPFSRTARRGAQRAWVIWLTPAGCRRRRSRSTAATARQLACQARCPVQMGVSAARTRPSRTNVVSAFRLRHAAGRGARPSVPRRVARRRRGLRSPREGYELDSEDSEDDEESEDADESDDAEDSEDSEDPELLEELEEEDGSGSVGLPLSHPPRTPTPASAAPPESRIRKSRLSEWRSSPIMVSEPLLFFFGITLSSVLESRRPEPSRTVPRLPVGPSRRARMTPGEPGIADPQIGAGGADVSEEAPGVAAVQVAHRGGEHDDVTRGLGVAQDQSLGIGHPTKVADGGPCPASARGFRRLPRGPRVALQATRPPEAHAPEGHDGQGGA